MTRFAAVLLALTLGIPSPAAAQALSEEDVSRIVRETIAADPAIVLDAILENPDVVMRAVDILRGREAAEEEARQAAALTVVGEDLRSGRNAPVLGNPEGDVTVVEFFDYNCGFCKRSAPVLRRLLDEDGNVRVVMREFPILSEGSVVAAKASLASRMQGKYGAFHFALLDFRGPIDEAAVMRVAAKVGLDLERLKADMESGGVLSHLEESRALADALGISGTPYFLIGDKVAPGFIDFETMRNVIGEERGRG